MKYLRLSKRALGIDIYRDKRNINFKYHRQNTIEKNILIQKKNTNNYPSNITY